MRLGKALILSSCLLLAACAGQKTAATSSTSSEDFVEIANPGFTMSADQPATIWVPRSYVESGIPRGKELVKKGYEKVFPSKSSQTPATQAQINTPLQQKPIAGIAAMPTPVSSAPATVAAAPFTPKHRMVVIEIGLNGLTLPLQEQLRRAGVALMADPAQASFLAQSVSVATPEGKSSFATRLQQEYNVNEVIYVGAANGLASGNTMTAEVYDTMGGGLLRGFNAVIPSYKETDQPAKNAAIAEALATIAARVIELATLLPWYSRITAVNGNRAYIPAGKEAGLRVGQTLKVYHGGKFLKGLGFAPGSKIGMLEVEGFVGPNGAFCAIRDGRGIEASDVVTAE